MSMVDNAPVSLQDKLSRLIEGNTGSYTSANGEAAISAHSLPEILRSLSSDYGVTLLNPEEESNLATMLSGMPDLELSASQMIPLIESLTAVSLASSTSLERSASSSSLGSVSSSGGSFSLDGPNPSFDPAELEHSSQSGTGSTPSTPPDEPKTLRLGSPMKETPPQQTRRARNIFEGRERTAPLDATPLAFKKRPQRMRGRSETTFAGHPDPGEHTTPKPSKSSSSNNSRRNSVHGHYAHHRMLSNPTSPILAPSPTASSPTSPLFGHSRLPSPRDYFSPELSRRSMSPDSTQGGGMLFDGSFISRPVASPDLYGNGHNNSSTHHGFSSFVSPSTELFLDNSFEEVHSSSPPASPEHDVQHDTPSYNRSFSSYSRSRTGGGIPLTPEEADEFNAYTSKSSRRLSLHRLNTTSGPLSSSSFDSPPRANSADDEIDELQKANASLWKKLKENQKELEHKVLDHETQVNELQMRIEELEGDILLVRREEKESKVKERTTGSQLALLEVEMSKLQRQFETSREQYQSLQKQYQEQCATAEKYRDVIRQKDEELKHVEDLNATHALESNKWRHERDVAEATIDALRLELESAQQAALSLDEQKAANLALKETIDRLRLDLDEIRSSASPVASGSVGSSAGSMMLKNAARKSLMTLDMELNGAGDTEGSASKKASDGDDSAPEDDGFEETVITTRRRRLASNRRSLPAKFALPKQLVDSSTQHDSSDFTASIAVQAVETPRQTSTATTQTSPQPSPLRQLLAASTSSSTSSARDVFDATLVDDEDENDEPRSASSFTLDALSPSSQVLRKPTEGALFLKGVDLPPSYAHLEAEERQRERRDYIERWHPDMSPTRSGLSSLPSSSTSPNFPLRHSVPLPLSRDRNHGRVENLSFDEVSREAIERWKSLKQELGFECDVIDQALETRRAPVTPQRSPAKAAALAITGTPPPLASSEEYLKTMTPRLAREWFEKIKADAEAHGYPSPEKKGTAKERTPRWQFYNLYNSVFYPTTESAPAPPEPAPKRGWNITLTSVGVWALVLMTATVIPAAMKAETNSALDIDARLWNSVNNVAAHSAGFEGALPQTADANDAFWDLTTHLIKGAANVVRRHPAT